MDSVVADIVTSLKGDGFWNYKTRNSAQRKFGGMAFKRELIEYNVSLVVWYRQFRAGNKKRPS